MVFMQIKHVETVIPLDKVLWVKPGNGVFGIVSIDFNRSTATLHREWQLSQ
jgi:hypothetical protein